MDKVRLKRADFGGVDGRAFLLGDGAVSNGHWAIRRRAVRNADRFERRERAAEFLGYADVGPVTATFDESAKAGAPTPWARTEFLHQAWPESPRVRLYRNQHTGELAGLDERYVTLAGSPETLWATDAASPFRDGARVDEADFLCMPVRLGFTTFPTLWRAPEVAGVPA
jgi:hypothetical protein